MVTKIRMITIIIGILIFSVVSVQEAQQTSASVDAETPLELVATVVEANDTIENDFASRDIPIQQDTDDTPPNDTDTQETPAEDTETDDAEQIDTDATEGETEETEPEEDPIPIVSLRLTDVSGGPVNLQGLQNSQGVWIELPYNWEIDLPLEVTLFYTASELLNPQLSSFTIMVNGQSVKSIAPEASDALQTVTFLIPPELVFEGSGFFMEFHSYLRVTENECEPMQIPSQWVTIGGETEINLPVDEIPLQPSLAQISNSFYSNSFFMRDIPTIFVVPSFDDATSLSIAANIAMRLGAGSFGQMPTLVVRTPDSISEMELINSNIIAIGLPLDNIIIDQAAAVIPFEAYLSGEFYTRDANIVPNGDGVLHLINNPWNLGHNLLIVSGNDVAGLERAGLSFSNTVIYESLSGTSQFISAVGDLPESEEVLPWTTNVTTFEQMGIQNRFVYGNGASVVQYAINRPAGWLYENGAQLTVNMAHTPLQEGSHVAVFLDGVFLGDVETNGVERTSVTFSLPVEELNQAYLDNPQQTSLLRLEVANVISVSDCELIDPQSIWTQVDASSYLETPHDYVPLPHIQVFPYPFVSDNSTLPTTIVLPNDTTHEDVETGLLLATRLGRHRIQDFSLMMMPEANMTAEAQNANLLILGERQRQPLITQIPGAPNTDDLTYESLIVEQTGLIWQTPSPFNNNRYTLVITGDIPENYRLAAASLIYSFEDDEFDTIRITEDTPRLRVIVEVVADTTEDVTETEETDTSSSD